MLATATTETAIAKTSSGPMGYGSLAPNTEHARMSQCLRRLVLGSARHACGREFPEIPEMTTGELCRGPAWLGLSHLSHVSAARVIARMQELRKEAYPLSPLGGGPKTGQEVGADFGIIQRVVIDEPGNVPFHPCVGSRSPSTSQASIPSLGARSHRGTSAIAIVNSCLD